MAESLEIKTSEKLKETGRRIKMLNNKATNREISPGNYETAMTYLSKQFYETAKEIGYDSIIAKGYLNAYRAGVQ